MTHDTWLRRLLRRLSAWADKRPAVAAAVERVELAVKKPMFGCQACGNCVLGHMEYVCPQTCPKQMRNGPCGGTLFGRCEVVDQPCIWVSVWDRAKAAGSRRRAQGLCPAAQPLAVRDQLLDQLLPRPRQPPLER